jgi:glutamine phosphoribosylpyrophosphate amidotransferase
MCGIVGAVAERDVVPILLAGLQRLAYRGYDSAGLAVIGQKKLERRRVAGKVDNLSTLLQQRPLRGHTGIAHTRWATHGVPSKAMRIHIGQMVISRWYITVLLKIMRLYAKHSALRAMCLARIPILKLSCI